MPSIGQPSTRNLDRWPPYGLWCWWATPSTLSSASGCGGQEAHPQRCTTQPAWVRRGSMTIPQWALLGFAVWTLLVLFGTVGVYRWSRILTGQVRISEWQARLPQGSDWYQRAMRAHMNCVENLPVFAAIVLCATATGADNRFLDLLAGVILVARIG